MTDCYIRLLGAFPSCTDLSDDPLLGLSLLREVRSTWICVLLYALLCSKNDAPLRCQGHGTSANLFHTSPSAAGGGPRRWEYCTIQLAHRCLSAPILTRFVAVRLQAAAAVEIFQKTWSSLSFPVRLGRRGELGIMMVMGYRGLCHSLRDSHGSRTRSLIDRRSGLLRVPHQPAKLQRTIPSPLGSSSGSESSGSEGA